MKSIATTALAGLMLLGTISAIATTKHSKQMLGFSDGGPVPLCTPDVPNCPPPMPTGVKALASDGGPVPLCTPDVPNCPPPMPSMR
jgi:hypothetical protein